MLFQGECPQPVSPSSAKNRTTFVADRAGRSPHVRSPGEAERGRDYRLMIMFAPSARIGAGSESGAT
jgi:hypothetical protein